MDHDWLFKKLLTTFFAEFLQLFFPGLAAYLDPDSVEFLDKELFTNVKQGERQEADLVAHARFRGQALCFLIHVENQAQPQANFPRRMFGYFARLHEKYDLPVYPIAVFSYDSRQPANRKPTQARSGTPVPSSRATQLPTCGISETRSPGSPEGTTLCQPRPTAWEGPTKSHIQPQRGGTKSMNVTIRTSLANTN
jgi:hypothetical protein